MCFFVVHFSYKYVYIIPFKEKTRGLVPKEVMKRDSDFEMRGLQPSKCSVLWAELRFFKILFNIYI